jgi:hypothetical protein
MQLASSFRPNSPVLRSNVPLSDHQIHDVAPSIFAEGKHDSRSERYTYIPTIDVLRGLRMKVSNRSWCAKRACAIRVSANTQSTCSAFVTPTRLTETKPTKSCC